MKTSSLLSFYFLLAFIFFNLNTYAQIQTSNSTIIYIEKAGELSKHISSNEKYKITNLTIVGYLNRDDLDLLKDMAGNSERINDSTEQNASQYKTDGKLSILNLYDAKIQNPQDICFSHCLSLTSIILPKDLQRIDDGTFFKCSNLKNIEMNNIYKIGFNAFYGCSSLTDSTIIPRNVIEIEDGAFDECTGFSKIVLPDNIKLKKNVFRNCYNIKEFIVSQQNENLVAIDGILLSKDLQTLIAYPLGKKEIIFPKNITRIGKWSFYGCKNITNITIPRTVKEILEGAFSECIYLNTLKIPNSVKSIGGYAFWKCYELKKIYIENSIPPYIYSDSFGAPLSSDFNKSACDLYIPKGAYNNYWLKSVWREFNIVENDFITSNENTISNEKVKIYSSNGIIIINNVNKKIHVSIFNLQGQLICNFETMSNKVVQVEKGIYIVNVDNFSVKVKVD